MVDGFAKSPRYVLNEGSHPTCPPLMRTSSDVDTFVIYGFSTKSEYDIFLSSSLVPLTPYPLVKRFLTSQIDADEGALKLVVLDAASSADGILYAATFVSVLESLRLSSECVTISHHLILEDATQNYRIEALSY